jgi:sporulation protein YqfC
MQVKGEKSEERVKNTKDYFYFELSKRGKISSAVIGGVIGILDFSDKNVFLATHSGRINISGERLNVAIFENKTIQITGKIADIRLV